MKKPKKSLNSNQFFCKFWTVTNGQHASMKNTQIGLFIMNRLALKLLTWAARTPADGGNLFKFQH